MFSEIAITKILELADPWEKLSDENISRPTDPRVSQAQPKAPCSGSQSRRFNGQVEGGRKVLSVLMVATSLDYAGSRPVSSVSHQLGILGYFFWGSPTRECLIQIHALCHNTMTGSSDIKAAIVLDRILPTADSALNLTWLCQMYQNANSRIPGLLAVASILQSKDCSDPRDRLYAGLGMTKELELVEPDYGLDVDEVYVRTARKWIEKYQDFHILGYRTTTPKPPRLPSWTPDWHYRSPAFCLPLYKRRFKGHAADGADKKRVYNAARNSLPVLDFENRGRTLVTWAKIVEFVSFVGNLLPLVKPDVRDLTGFSWTDGIFNDDNVKAAGENHLFYHTFNWFNGLCAWV
jgi:hypothetical protein